jgi:hypothetical protein
MMPGSPPGDVVQPVLVILAAGLANRYGGMKQLEPVGPCGEALLDYSIYDAVRAGFGSVVLVVGPELETRFRRHLADTVGDAVPVGYVSQELDDLPDGRKLSAGRQKPWGTGHAVLAARRAVSGPFAVCNADDFYGASSYGQLAAHLVRLERCESTHVLVGYPLHETLSPFGGVSRCVVLRDEVGYVVQLTEVEGIRRVGGRISGTTVQGERVDLTGDELVSMNLWGSTPQVFIELERQFSVFLEDCVSDPAAEFLLVTGLNEQMEAGVSRIAALEASDKWFGMTFPEDRERVREAMADLVGQGIYPNDLREGFDEL